jgi:hypothetical protein
MWEWKDEESRAGKRQKAVAFPVNFWYFYTRPVMKVTGRCSL